jgi:putative flippase GtrA
VVGAAGGVLMAFALATRWRAVFPFGLVLVGASYAVFLAVRNGSVDPWAPVVAAALLVAAELGYWSLERSPSRSERAVVLRRLAGLAGAAVVTVLVGSLVLLIATGAAGGVALEAAGVAAAVLAVAAITRLASRASV